MTSETCLHHTQLASDIAVIKSSLTNIETVFTRHVDESERAGGYRDRIVIVEQEVKNLKKEMNKEIRKVGITAGLIGALLGNIVPEAIILLSKWIVGR